MGIPEQTGHFEPGPLSLQEGVETEVDHELSLVLDHGEDDPDGSAHHRPEGGGGQKDGEHQ